MITKKATSQKGFRLSDSMMDELSKISTITGRSQNELVELSIQDFIKENIIYVIESDIILNVSTYLEKGFKRLYGDLLVNYRYKVEGDNKQHIFTVYQINELLENRNRMLDDSLLVVDSDPFLESCMFTKIITEDKKAIIDLLHEKLINYNFKTQMMQRWINNNYTY